MLGSHIAIGKMGEENGVSYLKQIGYKIIDRNFKTPLGEVDVIARYQDFLVFVEIKTRRHQSHGLPEESVVERKQRKIAQVADWYLKAKRLGNVPVRFDVLAVLVKPDGTFEFRLIENAFEVGS